ncbi:NAD(P)H-dependent FMN reductase LOT6 [Phialemonium atrogriseum]|uniref:NAD(P)H-dependent FMN reductase LOT6 n=1 Tax=Phialemonium atrogriseum TaxID=1093897 RepID=A0AAJ0FLL4_9PEZI|nr:NAD(P)H-dependent FMN reductase LOT6 [Phialemonium atrogriseum]KAK1767488.1 NAD(P)H-dependent FMN reductase LOT6 [Phialemonium atrogriseum]
MSSPKSVAVITFSTRTPRVGPEIAAIVKEILDKDAEASGIQLTPVDLADFNLPVYDEPVVPAMVPANASFIHQHSIAWSAEIKKHDGYVLVIPEYNFGMAGGTKNAIDYLKHEWVGKPAAIVSYGIEGGKTASEQLNHTLTMLTLRVAATRPALRFFGDHGPEMQSAVFQGKAGPESRKEWAEKDSVDILKAFAELKELLTQEPPPPEKQKV